MSMDMISIARRLEILSKNRLAEMVEVVDGMKVYALPGSKPAEVVSTQSYAVRVTRTAEGEKVFNLSDAAPSKDES